MATFLKSPSFDVLGYKFWVTFCCISIALIGGYGHWYGYYRGYGYFSTDSWDEETYGLFYRAGDVDGYRNFSYGFFRGLQFLLPNIRAIWVCFDVIIPVLTFLAALLTARQIWGEKRGFYISTALGFLIAPPVFSIGYNLTMWTSKTSVLSWGNSLPDSVKLFVPWTHATTYNPFFRTPEPQISAVLLFLVVFLLLKSFQGDRMSSMFRLGILAMGAVFTTSYLFCSVPVLCFAFNLIAVGLILRIHAKKLSGAGLFILGFVIVTGAKLWMQPMASGSTLIYSSRSPTVTPLVILSLVGCLVEIFLFRRHSGDRRTLVLVLSAFLVPLLLQNQQIITGKMVMPGKWEEFGGPLFFFLGLCFSMAQGGLKHLVTGRLSLRMPSAIVGGVAGLAAFATLALIQIRTVKLFSPTNLQASSLVESISNLGVDEPIASETRVFLSQPHMDTMIQFRMAREVEFVYGYLTTVKEFPIERMTDEITYRRSVSKAFPVVFEHISRMGWRPDDLRRELISIADGKGGFLAMALFNFMDVWAPFSEGRALNLGAVSAQSDWLVSSYRQYLASAPPEWEEESYLTLLGDSEKPNWNPIWETLLVSDEHFEKFRVRIYRQRKARNGQALDSI